MKAPFVYFGGKSAVAPDVWEALGCPSHYLEPFFGSGAVLLARPHSGTETVCDADGHIANVWRALQTDPDAVAKWCDWPVNHADLIARKKVLNERNGQLLESLCADDKFYDTELAGYWIWAASCWIGHGLVCPTQIPHIVHAGKGVHAKGQIPHLTNAGKGVHAKGQIPHLTNAGMGVQDPYNTRIYEWFRELSERLRHVRVVCGDWTRICGGDWQDKLGTAGIFFDPPYSDVADRDPGIYTTDSATVAHDVRDWCLQRGDKPNYRIVLAGYYDEHASLLDNDWRIKTWSAAGGYSQTARSETETRGQKNRHKEALFFSPHCIESQRRLFT